MDEEQPVRIVFSFDFSEARVVAPPVRVLPSVLEVIALAHVRSRVRHECTKLTHASIDALRSFAACHNRWLMSGNSRICRSLGVACDRQSEGGQHRWIRCGVLRPGDRVGWRSGESLIEVQFDTRMPRAANNASARRCCASLSSSDSGSHSDSITPDEPAELARRLRSTTRYWVPRRADGRRRKQAADHVHRGHRQAMRSRDWHFERKRRFRANALSTIARSQKCRAGMLPITSRPSTRICAGANAPPSPETAARPFSLAQYPSP